MQFAGAIGLDVFMTMVISALSIRLASKVFIVPKGVADQLAREMRTDIVDRLRTGSSG